jgi:hypothetical protein
MLFCFEQHAKITKELFMKSKKTFLLLFLIFIASLSKAVAEEGDKNGKASSFIKNTQGTFLDVNKPFDNAKKVTVGIYVVNISDIDVQSNIYQIGAYLWLRWRGNFDPVESLDFINRVENSDFTKKALLSTPGLLHNGEKYQVIRINGVFFQSFDLRNYPLDKQELSLYIENSTDSYDRIFYVPDKVSSGYDVGLIIPGWQVIGLTENSYIHDYGTDFGELGIPKASMYSVVKFVLHLDRHVNFFVWKLFIPLLIILLTNWLSLILKPTFFEVRATLPATALLTIIFLQQSALDAIPGCPSLVLMDKIYLLAYFCVILTLLQIFWVDVNLDKESSSSIQKMIKIDRVSFVAQIFFFVVVFAVLADVL